MVVVEIHHPIAIPILRSPIPLHLFLTPARSPRWETTQDQERELILGERRLNWSLGCIIHLPHPVPRGLAPIALVMLVALAQVVPEPVPQGNRNLQSPLGVLDSILNWPVWVPKLHSNLRREIHPLEQVQ